MSNINVTSKLGDYFVAFKLATRKQIDACRRTLLPGQMLGHALVKANVCDRAVCETVATVQRRYQKTAAQLAPQGIRIMLDHTSFIGDIMMALGFISPAQHEFWLQHQEQERLKGNNPGRLGELLVEHNVCTAAERDLAMTMQNWLRGVN